MNGLGFPLLKAITDCHRRLSQHAIDLKGFAEILEVIHDVQLTGSDDSYRHVEFVDVELTNDEALSWCLEVCVTETSIEIEADITRIHALGQDKEAVIGKYRFESESECTSQLREITERLCSTNPLSNDSAE